MRTRAMDSLAESYARCEHVPDSTCKLWQGAMLKEKYPISQLADPSRASGVRQVHVRRRVWELAKGKPAPKGGRYVLVARCGNDCCVAEECLELKTKSKRLREVAATGVYGSPAFRARVAAGKRRDSKLSDEAVAQIVAGVEPIPVLAQRHGLSDGYAYAIQRGEHRRDYTSPFSALVPPRM